MLTLLLCTSPASPSVTASVASSLEGQRLGSFTRVSTAVCGGSVWCSVWMSFCC